jgi:hypothetical protein
MQFLNQITLLPLAALLYSMEMFVKTMQGIQEIAGQSIKALANAATQTLDAAPTSERDLTSDGAGDPIGDSDQNAQRITRGGERQVERQDDLGGDDLKYVSYSILFTKRDHEATLQQEREEIVDYLTNAGSYGGLKIGEFMRSRFPRPRSWIENGYPQAIPRNQMDVDPATEIPAEDRKYITFVYRVSQRLAKNAEDYDRRQARALEEISRTLGDRL